jgi:hypothetical protein
MDHKDGIKELYINLLYLIKILHDQQSNITHVLILKELTD